MYIFLLGRGWTLGRGDIKGGVESNFALSLSPLKNPNEGSTKGHRGVGVQGVRFLNST